MKVYYLLLVSAIYVWITPTHSRFFYSHYTPLSSPIFSQTFLPTLPAVSPLAYTPRVASTSSVTYNIPNVPTAEYRGFGYRTDYKDGASSTVFYVTGPEAQYLKSFMDFPSFAKKSQDSMPAKARSLASDLTDLNAIPDAHGKIQSILQPADFERLFDAATPGVVNFYSFPAGTVPLASAREVENTTTNVTTTTPSSKEEHVAAESVVNSKVVVNAIENMIKSNGTTTENTEKTTNTTTTTTTTTTESTSAKASTERSMEIKIETTTAFLVNVDDEDATTVSNEETTTQV